MLYIYIYILYVIYMIKSLQFEVWNLILKLKLKFYIQLFHTVELLSCFTCIENTYNQF